MKEVASLRYGVIFKKAFCVPEIFTAFANDFLNINLKIDKVETEKSFSPVIGNIDTQFDLFAEDKENRVIVDIQHERYTDHYHRFLYYHCIALIERVSSVEDYRPGPDLKVYTIVILTSGDRYKNDIGIINFDPVDLEGNPLGEIPHKIIYICPKYLNDKTPEPYREWMLAINDSLDEKVDESKYKRPEIHKIFQIIEKNLITPKENAAMKDEYSLKLLIEERARKKSKEWIEKGRQEERKITALNLLKMGTLTNEQISQATGLNLKDVKKL
ncbi:transposase [Candidatus Magnetomoraceae bacterium gMMP-15]